MSLGHLGSGYCGASGHLGSVAFDKTKIDPGFVREPVERPIWVVIVGAIAGA